MSPLVVEVELERERERIEQEQKRERKRKLEQNLKLSGGLMPVPPSSKRIRTVYAFCA